MADIWEQQRLLGLQSANAVRSRRAQLKREIGAMDPSEALEFTAALVQETPEWLRSMPLSSMLASVRAVGPVKVNGFLRVAGCSSVARLGALTPRQRGVLAYALRSRSEARVSA